MQPRANVFQLVLRAAGDEQITLSRYGAEKRRNITNPREAGAKENNARSRTVKQLR